MSGVVEELVFSPLDDYNGDVLLRYKVTDGNGIS